MAIREQYAPEGIAIVSIWRPIGDGKFVVGARRSLSDGVDVLLRRLSMPSLISFRAFAASPCEGAYGTEGCP